MTAPVYGLILAGGASSRMKRDKAALQYQGKTQLDRAFELVGRHVNPVFVSVRASQASDPTRAHRPLIVDSVAGEGPIVGIRSALAAASGGRVAGRGMRFTLPRRCRARASFGGTRPEARAPPPIAAPMMVCPSRCALCGSPKPPPSLPLTRREEDSVRASF